MRSKREAVEKGSHLGGRSPFAYRIVGKKHEKRLEITDPGKVKIVQRIYHEFVVDGRTRHAIAMRLNKDGYPAPRGKVGRIGPASI